MEKPKLRFTYKHVTGKFYFVHGFAKAQKDPDKNPEIVIISDLATGEVEYIAVDIFFQPHPTTGVTRFELVTP